MFSDEIRQKKQIGRSLCVLMKATKSFIHENHINLDISSGQMPVLSFLIDENDVVVSQETIRAALGFDKATITRAVKTLYDLGYLNKERDRKDKRAFNLSLTDKGKSFKLEVFRIMKSWSDIMYKDISQDEIDSLDKILSKMLQNVKNYQDER
ncbi:winged helix-turn-helix transcriptional regulator [bacterium]|nr:winged helix-turn-helix transcriptional regulator [bacterium]